MKSPSLVVLINGHSVLTEFRGNTTRVGQQFFIRHVPMIGFKFVFQLTFPS